MCSRSSRPELDAREVENVVDDGEEVTAGRADRPHKALMALRQLLVGEQVGHAEDTRHRRADLMAHRRQELGLRPRRLLGHGPRLLRFVACRLGGLLGLAQLHLAALARHHVEIDGERSLDELLVAALEGAADIGLRPVADDQGLAARAIVGPEDIGHPQDAGELVGGRLQRGLRRGQKKGRRARNHRRLDRSLAQPDRVAHDEGAAAGRLLDENGGAIAQGVVDDDLEDRAAELVRAEPAVGETVDLADQLRHRPAAPCLAKRLALLLLEAEQPGTEVVAFPPVVGELPLRLARYGSARRSVDTAHPRCSSTVRTPVQSNGRL